MLNLRKQLTLRRAVASKLAGHDHARHITKALRQSPELAFGCSGIPPRLNEDAGHDAVLAQGTPRAVRRSQDPDEHLVHVPLVPASWPAASRVVGGGPAKLLAPSTNRQETTTPRSARSSSTSRRLRLNTWYSQTGKTVAVARVGRGLHASGLTGLQAPCQIRLP